MINSVYVATMDVAGNTIGMLFTDMSRFGLLHVKSCRLMECLSL